MDEELEKLIEGAIKQGATDSDVKKIIDLYISDEKKNQVANGGSTSKAIPSESTSKVAPITSLGGEKTQAVKASGTSVGGKMAEFKGFSVDEQAKMQGKETPSKKKPELAIKNPLMDKRLKLKKDIAKTKITTENIDEMNQKVSELEQIQTQDSLNKAKPISQEDTGFLGYAEAEATTGLLGVAKALVKDVPEFIYDLNQAASRKISDALGIEQGISKYNAKDVLGALGINNEVADSLDTVIKSSNDKIEAYNQKNGGDVLTALSDGNYLGAAKMTAGATLQSAPLMLAAMFTGGGTAALATIGTVSGAMTYGELQEKSPEMDKDVQLASSVASGLLEGFLGKFFSGTSGAVAKRILAEKGVEAGSRVLAKGFKGIAMEAMEKNPVVGLVGEIIEEGSVEFGNQLIAISNGTRSEFDMRQVYNAGLSATGMGAINTVAVYGAKGYVKASDYKKTKAVNKEIASLSSELSNPNLSDSDKKILSSRVDKLILENKKTIGDGLNNIKALPNDVKTEIVDINNQLEDFRDKVIEIEDNSVMSPNVKDALITEIKSNVKELTDRKLKIIDGKYIYDDFNKLSEAEKIDRKDKASRELLNEAQAKGEEKASFDDAQITKKAVEDYGNERKQRSDREAADKKEPTGDQAVSEYQQPTKEGGEGVRGVQEEVKPTEAKGTPDVVSQPIDLTVPSKTAEAEAKPIEPTAVETPIIETPKESKARQTLVDKTKNAESELKTVLAKNAKARKPAVKKPPTFTEQLGITKKPAVPKLKTGKVSKDEVTPNVVVAVPDEMSIVEESKPTMSVDIVKTSDNGLMHASNFEGVPYEIEGGIGLVQGFSPFGNTVYIPYKGEYRIKTDVSSINETEMLTKEELARLKELRANLENQESKNESESKNPFEQQGRVASSDSVPVNVRDFVREITDSLGITSNIFIITDGDFNESQYKKHGLFGKLASIRSAVLSSKDSNEWGHKRAISDANANYIYYGGNLTESQVFSVVSHEIGHIVESELFKNASLETKSKVKADYDAWFAKLNGKTVAEVNKEARDITLHDLISNNTSEFNAGSHGYISSFSEYLADNVGKWVRSSENPKTIVDKFFSNIAEEFKKIYDYVFKTGNYSKSMFEWLDEQYLSNKKQGGAVSTDASLSKMKGTGESYDPKGNSKNQSSINKAILKYVVNKIALGAYDVNAFVKDMASNGIELTKEGADFLFDKSQKAYGRQIEKLTGVSRKPVVGARKTQKDINMAYAIGKGESRKETAEAKAELKVTKSELKDAKDQLTDVFNAAVEAIKIADKSSKDYSKFVSDKQNAIAEYVKKNIKGRLTRTEIGSLMKAVANPTDASIENANRIIDKVKSRTEKELVKDLVDSIKKKVSNSVIVSKKDKFKKINVSLAAKKFAKDIQKLNLESMNVEDLADLEDQINDVMSTGKADRNAMNTVRSIRRVNAEKEALLRYERKFKQGVASDNIDVDAELKSGNVVITDNGQVFLPGKDSFNPPMSNNIKGVVVVISKTNQDANKRFNKVGFVPKALRTIYSPISGLLNYSYSITYRFYDLISDNESKEFFENNVFNKLNEIEVRTGSRVHGYSKILNDKIYGSKKRVTGVGVLFKSNIKKTATVLAKKRGVSISGIEIISKGVDESIEFGQTGLVLNRRNGDKENLFEGATDSEVINLYNSLRDYNFLTKTFMKGGDFNQEDVVKIINYVNSNPELKKRAEALVETYAEIAKDLIAKTDEVGINLNIAEYLTEEEYRESSLKKNKGDEAIADAQTKQYMDILGAFYGSNIPKIVPYVPVSSEKMSSEDMSASAIIDDKGFYNPTVAFPNLLERKGGGNLVLKSYQESFKDYTNNVARFIEGTDALSDLTAMFGGSFSSRVLTEQFGKEWVAKSNQAVVDVILNNKEKTSVGDSFISSGAVVPLLGNLKLGVTQLSSIPGILVSLDNNQERVEYLKILKNRKDYAMYLDLVLNHGYIENRIDMSNHEYDAAMLKRLSEKGSLTSFDGILEDVVSDLMAVSTMADATSIAYGGAAFFGVKYNKYLKEYHNEFAKKISDGTMTKLEAMKALKEKASKEAMVKLAVVAEKTQQSSQNAFVSEFRKNKAFRAVGMTSFMSSSIQAGEMAIKSARDLKNGRGDVGENIGKTLYFGAISSAIFVVSNLLIKLVWGDDDEEVESVVNSILDSSLQQLPLVGQAVAVAKDFYLEKYAPEALAFAPKRVEGVNDKIVRYAEKFSPGLGVKIRDIKSAVDQGGKRSILQRVAATTQVLTNRPTKRILDIGENWMVAMNDQYSFAVRRKGLFAQIPDLERIKHKEHIDGIIKQSNELVGLSYSQLKMSKTITDGKARKEYINNCLEDRKISFVNQRLKSWFDTGFSSEKEASKTQASINNAVSDMKDNYISPFIKSIVSKDSEDRKDKLSKMIDKIKYYEKNYPVEYEAINNSFESSVGSAIKDETDRFKSLKRYGSGKPKAIALYGEVGDILLEGADSPGVIGIITSLEAEGVLDNKTIEEYIKYSKEMKLKE